MTALAWPLLLFPRRIRVGLERVREAGLVTRVPNSWQIALGVARMWHRMIFRPETVGTCSAHPVRATWRARLLEHRPLRFPFLVAERAIAPLDFSGLVSTRERIVRHLLAAHHDRNQFVYDFELLRCHPGGLEEVRARADAVVRGRDPRAAWLRDLVDYERYHEELLAAVEVALAGRDTLGDDERRDPDVSFRAYLDWCASQPETPEATLRAALRGELDLSSDPNRRRANGAREVPS